MQVSKTLYDVYPFTDGPLHEFTMMQSLPTQEDMAVFADTAIALVGADASAEMREIARDATAKIHEIRTSLWLPEGILEVVKVFDRDEDDIFEDDIPTSVCVMFDTFKVQADPNVSHMGEVTLSFSYKQQVAMDAAKLLLGEPAQLIKIINGVGTFSGSPHPFPQLPLVTDFGVRTVDQESARLLDSMVNLRDDLLPDSLDLRPGTFTGANLDFAEYQSKAFGLLEDLEQSGELDLFLTNLNVAEIWENALTTACSQRTMQALTSLMTAHL